MKLPVPFFKQTTPFNCGPTALRIVIGFLDKDIGIDILENETGRTGNKGTNTIQLAVASASLGYKTKLFTTHLSYNEENRKLDYYKKYDAMNEQKFDTWFQKAKELKMGMKEESISIDELLKFVTDKSLPIALVDWNVIKGETEKGYRGHFLPIVGYDKENVYVHNPSFSNPAPFFQIKKDIFNKARKSQGTDEDVVVIYKNASRPA
jgi:hypothetical protein